MQADFPTAEGFSISEEEYLKLGHPLDENVVRLNQSQGVGIFASLEVFHQMHCLVSIAHDSVGTHIRLYTCLRAELGPSVHVSRVLPDSSPHFYGSAGHTSDARW
jgi:hypothetical protein